MQTILVKLDPQRLENPDLDLRYVLPERVEAVSEQRIQDNGYDYLPDQCLGLWLQAEDAAGSIPLLIQLLTTERFLENDLSQSAEIYRSEQACAELEDCIRVYPADPFIHPAFIV